jgi:exportin-1
MAQAAQSMDVLGSMDNIKILSNVLKTNVSACTSIGSFYLPQIGQIFLDMLGLYKAVSGIISETVAREGLSSCVPYKYGHDHYILLGRSRGD